MRAAESTQTNPQQRKLLRVCRIGRAQGLKGEVNVRIFTDDPARRFAPHSVLVTRDGREFIVVKSRNFKNRWIVLFEGITDRNASEALNGLDLFVKKESSVPSHRDAEPFLDSASDSDSSDSSLSSVNSSSHSSVHSSEEILSGSSHTESSAELSEESEEEGWYLDDLVGLEVLQVDNPIAAREADYDGVNAHLIGTVSAVYNNTAQDLLEIKLDPDVSSSGKRTAFIPFVEQIVPIVDVEENYILVDPPAGLLDL